MVTFYDPVQQKELKYYISNLLLISWNKLKNGELTKRDDDLVVIVDGRERTGKSVFALQQAKYLDPTFNLDRVCFTPSEFLAAIRKAKKGEAIVFDEAFRGLSSKSVQSKINKSIVQALMEMGQKNLIVFIVLPTFFLLEMYPAVLRSHALIHVYRENDGKRRSFKIYNYHKKQILYQYGRKHGFSYNFPKSNARDKFFNAYAIDEISYRKKKEKSLETIEKDVVINEESDSQAVRDKNLTFLAAYEALKEKLGMTYEQFATILTANGRATTVDIVKHALSAGRKQRNIEETRRAGLLGNNILKDKITNEIEEEKAEAKPLEIKKETKKKDI